MRRPRLRIETGAGVLSCEIDAEIGLARSVAVDMGRPRLTRDEIPLAPGGAERAVREAIEVDGRSFRFTAVSMGNPHAVFLDDEGDLRTLAERFGPKLEVAERFPRRTNVEFARLRNGEIDLVVWERGCGITLACGTGACATVVAACLEGRLTPGVPTPVHLLEGTLVVTVANDYSGVLMRGPARTVFEGTVDLRAMVGGVGPFEGPTGDQNSVP
jgi:diaminopimelate epimerase